MHDISYCSSLARVLSSIQRFWRGEPYSKECDQELSEENVRTFLEEIDEEVSHVYPDANMSC
jgi:exonuclease VII small subunit